MVFSSGRKHPSEDKRQLSIPLIISPGGERTGVFPAPSCSLLELGLERLYPHTVEDAGQCYLGVLGEGQLCTQLEPPEAGLCTTGLNALGSCHAHKPWCVLRTMEAHAFSPPTISTYYYLPCVFRSSGALDYR